MRGRVAAQTHSFRSFAWPKTPIPRVQTSRAEQTVDDGFHVNRVDSRRLVSLAGQLNLQVRLQVLRQLVCVATRSSDIDFQGLEHHGQGRPASMTVVVSVRGRHDVIRMSFVGESLPCSCRQPLEEYLRIVGHRFVAQPISWVNTQPGDRQRGGGSGGGREHKAA